MRSPTTDAAILIYARVESGRPAPTAADCWLLDAFHHLMGSWQPRDGRASERWPDPGAPADHVRVCAWCPDSAARTAAATRNGRVVTHAICDACRARWEAPGAD